MGMFSQPKYKAPAIPDAPPPPPKAEPAPTKQENVEASKQDVLSRKKYEAGRDKSLLAQTGNQGKKKKKTLLGG